MAKYSDRSIEPKCIESARFSANYGLNIESECMESMSSLPRDKDEISQLENRSIVIGLSMLLGLILLNFWFYMSGMSASIEQSENNSAKGYVLDD
ncbi:MAG: hypothetical protein ACFBSE_06895 [Prochloraceae cyanobacterium]